ncbi:2-hydroxyacid dehydrogenase [Priestia filamentosa]|uniref:Glyoxylate/hydroxypyruvate reductase B n=1 Tax=Priestia filamentosa TaxID=1402861 RepID=A0A1X7E6V3_9BACI|nr:D-glycerate dehydrogenase [Priestia filamentosa]AKO92473.1 bifunctional glyoxylate/hydroxypyruvate reductase B [Priestia filamentosa]MDT3762538.1 D-glycerate dehydrogenase [Priestia filamentosa]OXS69088.1 D-glycerate dehydrogenase [Priestia filamentosa]RJS64203.1 D-glycerate dehydrogenase [Priestia filamentosa]WCM17601.1 D-glycerate dehydrogenase [Priestia filamentosa]
MKPKVIVYKKMDEKVLNFIRETCEVIYFEKLHSDVYPTFLEKLKDADALLGSGLKVNEDLLDRAPHLKIVCNTSVGYDNLDLEELSKRNIIATNTPDVLNDTVADTIFGLLLATARRMPELDQFVKNSEWKETLKEEHFGVDVHHKTLGIIGMGGVGSAIAKRAHFGFDMDILYHGRSRKEEEEQTYNATYCSLEELLQKSDFVCLMTPLTPQTEGLMGKREFELMKQSAIFINGSRGKTVDEEALINALRAEEILGAGLDVFAQEPVSPDNPLLSMKNVVTLPHIGSATAETRLKMAMLGAKNLVAGVKGETPPNLIKGSIGVK